MKKSKLKKRGKQPISVIQRKVWELCKRIIRHRHGNVCYTCGRAGLEGSNWHTGHLWAKASLGAKMKYDLRVLRPQCYNCNINWGGHGAVFFQKMLSEFGQEYMDRLSSERNVQVKAYDHYMMLLSQYQEIADNLSTPDSF